MDKNELSFWNAMQILITKPHVVNSRVWGGKVIFKIYCKSVDIWNAMVQQEGTKLRFKVIDKDTISIIIDSLKLQLCDETETDAVEILIMELLPKVYAEAHAYQLVCIQKTENAATFHDITAQELGQKLCPTCPYKFEFTDNNIFLICEEQSKSSRWLRESVLPHVLKWFNEDGQETNQSFCNQSLVLISNDKYYEKYNYLKIKYGKEMVKVWPECTDPTKFVYEDVAIATYLLLLWEEERLHSRSSNLQTFVDLGCGNGLLVYILTMEGHCGQGIDVKRRHIWNLYPIGIQLKEDTIIPSDAHLFPDTDWIIGNHSDELTPWIPVIAAQSSYRCKFFLLPCCAFNFDGSKYQRYNSNKSQYIEYLEHIRQICENCGYLTDIDRLKIPSTKRICLIGRARKHTEELYPVYCKQIKGLIRSHTTKSTCDVNEPWIKDFKARDSNARVRNCTKLEKSLVDLIVQIIFHHLLEGCKLESDWNIGRIVEISELANIIPPDKLKSLKSECGGLQTLLRNNHSIFRVHNGKVQLQYPRTVVEIQNGKKKNNNKICIKQKLCWFYNHHPQGCPLTEADCSYSHVK